MAGEGSDFDAGVFTQGVDDDRPPICPACGVTTVPVALSENGGREGDWICLECEGAGELDAG